MKGKLQIRFEISQACCANHHNVEREPEIYSSASSWVDEANQRRVVFRLREAHGAQGQIPVEKRPSSSVQSTNAHVHERTKGREFESSVLKLYIF